MSILRFPKFVILGISIALLVSCKNDPGTIPVVTTTAITEDSLTTAVSGGTVRKEGGAEVSARGVCWSMNHIPTVEDEKTTDGTGTGIFTSTLTNLPLNTKYKLRAYATNSFGTAYGELVIFTTGALTDADGNVYHIVTIGSQVWMVENLKTSKYKDTTDIPFADTDAEWAGLTTPAYCWMYRDENLSLETYGALYNWYAVNTGKLCPEGWHVPDSDDWSMLIEYSGKLALAGGTLKEAGTKHWESPNIGADNYDGFTAISGSFRNDANGTFGPFGYYCYMWSATELTSNTTKVWTEILKFGNTKVVEEPNAKGSGLFVRCIKDRDK